MDHLAERLSRLEQHPLGLSRLKVVWRMELDHYLPRTMANRRLQERCQLR